MRRRITSMLQRMAHPGAWGYADGMVGFETKEPEAAGLEHDGKLTSVLQHAVRHVPRYRDLAAQNGWKPEDVTHEALPDFPLVEKILMTEEQETFLAGDADGADRVADSTGGSSGVMFSFYTDRRQMAVRRATHIYSRLLAGWCPGDPLAVIWGHRGDVAQTTSFRRRLIDGGLFRQRTLNTTGMSDEMIDEYIAILQKHRPRILVGYASSLDFLASYLARRGSHGIDPVGIVSTAETLDEDMRLRIEREFDCPVFNRYGSREFANIAQQCEEGGGLHIFNDRIHVEVVRPDGTNCAPGEEGEVVVTDLANGVMPFIRYRTGDVGSLDLEHCPCGRTLPTLSAIRGRVSEIIVGKNGKYFSCLGPRLFGAEIPGIRQMQVIQDSLDEILVKIVATPEWTETSRETLAVRVRDLLGDMKVDIKLVDEIPRAASGKYRFSISSVSPFRADG